MMAFIIRRVVQSAGVLLAVSIIVFLGIYAIGNPIDILVPEDASAADRALAAHSLGLDLPLWEQYLVFLGNAMHGNLGVSFVFNQPAVTLILQRLPATLELAACAFLLSLVFGIPLGMLAGLRAGKRTDRIIMTGSIFGFSLPSFWQGMMLVMIFGVWLGWLPSTGRGDTGRIFGIETSLATGSGIAHLLLPAINLALYQIALLIRLVRSGMRETLSLDFVKFARAKGLSERRVVLVHVLKNIMIPIVTVIGLEIGHLIAFAVVTETIFAWPGVGKLLIDSIMRLDRPVIVAYLLVVVTMFILINLVVDIVYSILDPRIRLSDS